MRQRDLIKGHRDRVIRSMTAPMRFRHDAKAPGDLARERGRETCGGGAMDWSERDFDTIRARLAELADDRQRMLSGSQPAPLTSREESTVFFIYFDSGEDTVRGQRDVLDRAARAVGRCPDATVKVTGHTDRHGTDRENLDLGAVRAISVKKQLAMRDVPEDRIQCVSQGFRCPRLSSDPEAESADILNRRVEIRIAEEGMA
jgi:outer membrane protein OmpA-like peptidoglycan-associated protein